MSRGGRWWSAALGGLLVLLSGAAARAQPADTDPPEPPAGAAPSVVSATPAPLNAPFAEAERLFEAGKALADAGDWVASCALFEASARLRSVAPVLVKTARCRAREGALLAALDDYDRALALEPWAELAELIVRERDEVRGQAVTVRLRMPAPPVGLTITRNGRVLPSERWGEPFWLAPGESERLVAEAPLHQPRTFHVAGARAQRVELVIALTPIPAPVERVGADTVAGWTVLGAGVVTAGIGAVFGAIFLAGRGGLYDPCTAQLSDGRWVCPAEVVSERDALVSTRTTAQVLLGVGGATAAAGLIVLSTAPLRTPADAAGAPRLRTALQLGPGSVVVETAW